MYAVLLCTPYPVKHKFSVQQLQSMRVKKHPCVDMARDTRSFMGVLRKRLRVRGYLRGNDGPVIPYIVAVLVRTLSFIHCANSLKSVRQAAAIINVAPQKQQEKKSGHLTTIPVLHIAAFYFIATPVLLVVRRYLSLKVLQPLQCLWRHPLDGHPLTVLVLLELHLPLIHLGR